MQQTSAVPCFRCKRVGAWPRCLTCKFTAYCSDECRDADKTAHTQICYSEDSSSLELAEVLYRTKRNYSYKTQPDGPTPRVVVSTDATEPLDLIRKTMAAFRFPAVLDHMICELHMHSPTTLLWLVQIRDTSALCAGIHPMVSIVPCPATRQDLLTSYSVARAVANGAIPYLVIFLLDTPSAKAEGVSFSSAVILRDCSDVSFIPECKHVAAGCGIVTKVLHDCSFMVFCKDSASAPLPDADLVDNICSKSISIMPVDAAATGPLAQ